MGCFPCFGPAREEELEYYGAKGGGNGSAAASSSAAAGGGGAEAAALCAERIPAGACAASTRPLLPLPDRSLGLLVGSESDPCCGALALGLVSSCRGGWVGRSVDTNVPADACGRAWVRSREMTGAILGIFQY